MQEKEWFSNWFNSSYYHLLYGNRNDDEANYFIQNIIQHLQPTANSKMLDVACGKGRHSKALNEMGFDVVGIDLSYESIKAAKEFENEQLHFYTHDMRLPFYINYFDIAFNIFTSFGYFETQREHNNAMSAMCKSIKQNGILVIDYINTLPHEENGLQQTIEKKIDDLNFIITKWQTPTHFYKQIQVVENGNNEPKLLSTERVAKFSVEDFNKMLLLQNMQIQNIFGDYSLNNYDSKTSSRMIIIAKKINS